MMSIEVATCALPGKACLYKLGHIFNLVLPVHKLQVNVVSQLVNHILSYLILANNSHLLLTKLVDSQFYRV